MSDTSSQTIKIHEKFIEMHLDADASLESIEVHVDKICSFVEKLSHVNLLIVLNSKNSDDVDIDPLFHLLLTKNTELIRIGVYLKVAILTPVISQHKHVNSATNFFLFSELEPALTWLQSETALDNVTAFFQPIVSLINADIVGYETLARNFKNGKLLPTINWLPFIINEPNGSNRLTQKIIEIAAEQEKFLLENQFITVNFEVADIKSKNIIRMLEKYKNTTFLNKLIIEISEKGELILNSEEISNILNSIDFKYALDDLGVGYSRLVSIIDFSPVIIKIDKKLIERIHEEKVSTFLSTFSNWSIGANCTLLAEGIESREIAILCRKAGILYGQGFYFAKPSATLIRSISSNIVNEFTNHADL
ncbi:EAL domain-containing protein [Thalassotalea psychrophila]|uniref:EAL domain-containing protein n=1 Tax=Thalassotalea psychrophila TaxID=3065647 RepID=A0ABY9U5U8_9GAMM|nr:EAL domain-containing protein [Colwelliaceae bacterium SQ149]